MARIKGTQGLYIVHSRVKAIWYTVEYIRAEKTMARLLWEVTVTVGRYSEGGVVNKREEKEKQ